MRFLQWLVSRVIQDEPEIRSHTNVWCGHCSLVSSPSPSHCPVCKNGGGRPGPFYHMNDINFYLGSQGVPKQKRLGSQSLQCLSKCLDSERIQSGKLTTHCLRQRTCTKCVLSIGDPSPPLSTQVDIDVIHVIKWTRHSASVFMHCKQSKCFFKDIKRYHYMLCLTATSLVGQWKCFQALVPLAPCIAQVLMFKLLPD